VILAREVDGYSGLLKPLSFRIRRERLNPDQCHPKVNRENELEEDVTMLTYRELKGWKYELLEHISTPINIHPKRVIVTPYIQIHDSRLFVLERYAWDGPTVIPDSADLMLASLFHDALYQLIREGKLDRSFQKMADKLFKKIYISEATRLLSAKKKMTFVDKMSIRIWANTIHWAVKTFGKGALKA
jgi:hypothetical protein